MQDVAKTVARWVALSALFLIPLTPLVVANSFFFPFITGKAFFFRILVEAAVVAWISLALLDKRYRPRFSWIGAAVVAFVVWMAIADSLAPNATKAFWSNFERMEGWVLLIHLLGLFFAAGAVLRVTKLWRGWFLTTLAVSLVVSGYALLQLGGSFAIHQGSTRVDATLGNSSYLAIYLLFNVCLAGWLALAEKYTWLKYMLGALAVLEAVLVIYTETRGTVIALVVAIVLSAALALFTGSKRVKSAAALALALVLMVVGGLYLARHSDFVQQNDTLRRVTSISTTDGATRFTLWHMAYEGALERPIVGWGQEGYNYVFNKYYEASLYHQEQWFDRAHGTFIDWLVSGGFPAFFLYIALFVTAVLLLWRSSELSRAERIALTAALVGYAIHNFFVFDNLVSYVYFFMILALIDSQVGRPIPALEALPEFDDIDGTTYVLPIATVVVFVLVWLVNVPGMTVAQKLITALSATTFDAGMAAFTDLAAHPAFAAQEVREQIVNFAGGVAQNTQLSADQRKQAAVLAVTEMQKQIASYPEDAREHLELAYVYRAFGDYNDALNEMSIAETLSPQKIDTMTTEGITAWDAGDVKLAQQQFAKAFAFLPKDQGLAAYAAAGEIAVGDDTKADAILSAAYGTTTVDSDILAVAYYRAKAWSRLIKLWQMRAAAPSATAQTWFSLAAAYYAGGDTQSAVTILNLAAKQFPDAAAAAQQALAQIKAK